MNKNYHKFKAVLFLAFLLTAPLPVVAATTFSDLLVSIQNIINNAIPVLASLAVLGLFYGLVKYVFQADSEEGREKGKQYIIAGIVALFLMAAIGGIIDFLLTALGVDGSNTLPVPDISTD